MCLRFQKEISSSGGRNNSIYLLPNNENQGRNFYKSKYRSAGLSLVLYLISKWLMKKQSFISLQLKHIPKCPHTQHSFNFIYFRIYIICTNFYCFFASEKCLLFPRLWATKTIFQQATATLTLIPMNVMSSIIQPYLYQI